MIVVFVAGAKNSRQEDFFHDAVSYFVKKKLDHIDRFQLDVILTTKEELECQGHCKKTGFKIFQIAIAYDGIREMLYTLFHELTHLEQMLDGRLALDCGILWNGEKVSTRVKTIEEYRALPWEAEANTQMEILYNDYGNSKNKELIF